MISAKIPREFTNSTIYILPVIEMCRPSRDHIAFSQMSTATVSSLAYILISNMTLNKMQSPNPPYPSKNETNNLHDIAPFCYFLLFSVIVMGASIRRWRFLRLGRLIITNLIINILRRGGVN